jgi:hypothetical protein
MFYTNEGEKLIQMIPGQGWRLVIALDPEIVEVESKIVEEPIIAWAVVEMKDRVDFGKGDTIQQLVPLIRQAYPRSRGYMWEFSEWEDIGTVLLAPDEKRNAHHDERAITRQKAVAEARQEKYDKWEEARELRRAGVSFEAIADKLKISRMAARALAVQADEEMRREKQ